MSKDTGANPFQNISPKAWKQQIQYELSGEDYNEKLIYETPDGIKIKPFYTSEDISNQPALDTQKKVSSDVCFEIYANQAKISNEKAHWCINKGCDKILFQVQEPQLDPRVLLKDIPSHISIDIQLKKPTLKQITEFSDYLKDKNCSLWHCSVDPVSHFYETGNWWENQVLDFDKLSQMLLSSSKHTLIIDARRFYEAGASMAQQLAFSLSHFTEIALFISKNQAWKHIKSVHFCLKTGNNFIQEISKLRAFHLLWESLVSSFDTTLNYSFSTQGGLLEKTLFDNKNNLIRNNTALLAAALGGSKYLICTPYDSIHKKANETSDRLAINQALIIKNESRITSLNDPISGSYTIEKIASEMASKALDIYKKTEAAGGLIEVLKKNIVQNKIKEQFERQSLEYDQNKKKLMGSNIQLAFENFNIEKYPFIRSNKIKTVINPIIPRRFSMKWEQELLKTKDEH